MNLITKLLFVALAGFAVSAVQFVQGDEPMNAPLSDNETNTTTTIMTTTTTMITTTTTAIPPTTTPSENGTNTTTTTTTSPPPPTTTTPIMTTTTTVIPTTTTTVAPPEPGFNEIFNFTLPKTDNKTVPLCFKARFALNMTFTYMNTNKTEETLVMPLPSDIEYDGNCSDTLDELTIKFNKDWTLTYHYTLDTKQEKYSLSYILLNYVVDETIFKNVAPSELGAHNASSDVAEFSTNKDSSYKCYASTTVKLNEKVTLDFKQYQGEPFMQDKHDFDTAYECSADLNKTSKLVPIIVGSTLAVLVVLVLIAYIIGRRKHLSGYQQV